MAGELPPALQEFVADLDRYLVPIDEGIAAATRFATVNERVAERLGVVTEASESTAAGAGELAGTMRAVTDVTAEAAEATEGLAAAEVDATAVSGVYTDAQGRLRDAQGRYTTATAAAALTSDVYTDSQGRLRNSLGQYVSMSDSATKATEGAAAAARDNAAATGEQSKAQKIFSDLAKKNKRDVDLLKLSLMALAPAAVPVLAAVTLGVLSLGTALLGAGVGAAGFLAIAKPAFTAVQGALTKLTAAQEQYTKATNSKERVAALKAEKDAMDGLSPSERRLATAMLGLEDRWHSVQKALQPTVISALIPWVDTLKESMGFLPLVVKPAAKAIHELGDEAEHALKAPYWKTFFTQLGDLGGRALHTFGDAAGAMAKGVAGLITDFMPLGREVLPVILHLAQAFERWGQSAKTASGIRDLIGYVKANAPQMGAVLKQLALDIPKVVQALAGLGGGSLSGLRLMLVLIGHLSVHQLQAIAIGFIAIKTAMAGLAVAGKAAAGIKAVQTGLEKTRALFRSTGGAATQAAEEIDTSTAAVSTGVEEAAASTAELDTAMDASATSAAALGAALDDVAASSEVAGVAIDGATVEMGALDVAMDANPIGLIVLAIAALVGGLIVAYEKIGWFRHLVNDVFGFLKTAVVDTIGFVKRHWQVIVAVILGPIGIVVGLVVKHWGEIRHAFEEGVHFVIGFVKNNWKLLAVILSGPFAPITAFVLIFWKQIKEVFKLGLDWVVGNWEWAWRVLKGPLLSYLNWVKGNWVALFNFLKGPLTDYAHFVERTWSALWDIVSTAASTAWTFISSLVGGALKGLETIIGADLRVMGGFFKAGWEYVKIVFTTAWEALNDILNDRFGAALDKIKAFPGKVLHALSGLPTLLISAGESMIAGLLRGVENEAGALLHYISGLGGDVSNAFKHALSIFSPSRVFASHGQMIMAGLVQGIQSGEASAIGAIQHVAKSLTSASAAQVAQPGVSAARAGVSAGTSQQPIRLELTIQQAPQRLDAVQATVSKAAVTFNRYNPTGNGLSLQMGRS